MNIARITLGLAVLASGGFAAAEPLTLDKAVEMSLAADPRIKEREQLVEHSRALLEEVQGNGGWRISANMFLGLAPDVDGGFFQPGTTIPRSDGNTLKGVSDWTVLQFALIKPLATFGKLTHYGDAAQSGIDVKRGDVKVQRANTVLDVKRAWYGYLTARDTRRLLEEVQDKVDDATKTVERSLKDEEGEMKPSDLYALQAARGLLAKYLSQARAIETVSSDGIKVLTGLGLSAPIEVSDSRLEAVPLPKNALAELQAKAITDRPEMAQLEAGMRARRALVAAKKSEMYPDVYTGVIGNFAYTSKRDHLNNPHIYDPFDTAGATPVIGLKWETAFDVAPARVAQAQAELDALNARNQYALMGIPYEVAENFSQMQAMHQAISDLAAGSTAARRWMVAAFADFNAGLEKADKVADALKTYALTQAEYLKTVNDYNVFVAQLARVTGEPK